MISARTFSAWAGCARMQQRGGNACYGGKDLYRLLQISAKSLTVVQKIRKMRSLSRAVWLAEASRIFQESHVANTKQSKKRAKQAEKHRQHNASLRSMMRTYIKNVVKAVTAGDKANAEAAYKAAVPVIDRMADKGIIHKNKAARHKSRLNGHVRGMQ